MCARCAGTVAITCWIQHLSDIQVIDHVYDGFWTKTRELPEDGVMPEASAART